MQRFLCFGASLVEVRNASENAKVFRGRVIDAVAAIYCSLGGWGLARLCMMWVHADSLLSVVYSVVLSCSYSVQK